MVSEHIGDMTPSELRAFVESIIEEHISSTQAYRQGSTRSVGEVLESIRNNMVIPKPGTPSVVEMLREDRSR